MNRVWKFFTSLRLTVVCLAFGIILIWIGTVAQADEGLYQAQARYFKQWLVWGVTLWGHRIPVLLPGGYLLGVALITNLVAAHIKRFQWGWKKVGIHLTHAGVVIMLVGQLFTDQFSHETRMRFAEGETRNYSESGFDYELAFVSDLDPKNEQVVAIPAKLLAGGGELKNDKLPFTVRVKSFWPNSEPAFRAPMAANAPPLADKGVAQHFDFKPMPETHKMDDKNVPTAVVELVGPQGSLGTWVTPGWSGDADMVASIRRSFEQQAGRDMGGKIAGQLTEPQTVEAEGRKYTFSLRPARVYRPFAVTLLTTKNEYYAGSDIPKNFQSRVRIENPESRENREVDIFMNNPLRYAGLTFYQYQMGRDELNVNRGTSTLQVVRNPSWLAPYLGCIVVGIGMAYQFLFHLVGFIRKRTANPLPA
jgi:hypothetical protein